MRPPLNAGENAPKRPRLGETMPRATEKRQRASENAPKRPRLGETPLASMRPPLNAGENTASGLPCLV